MYCSHLWIGKINEKSGHWVMRIKAHPLEETHRRAHTGSPPNKHAVRSVCSFWTHSRGSISSNNSMHFCRFFLSALKEEQPPRTNERNFQTVIYFIRQMRCVSPLAVLTRNCPLSLSLSLAITSWASLYLCISLSSKCAENGHSWCLHGACPAVGRTFTSMHM